MLHFNSFGSTNYPLRPAVLFTCVVLKNGDDDDDNDDDDDDDDDNNNNNNTRLHTPSRGCLNFMNS